MSAIRVTCPRCGGFYIAGMVGSTPWPAHACPVPDAPASRWLGTEVAMVFDGESGNALDSFDYTAEELRRRADELEGRGVVTMEPSPFATLAQGR